jgi:hypothetical protein
VSVTSCASLPTSAPTRSAHGVASITEST